MATRASQQQKTQTKGVKMSSLPKHDRSDLPEYVKSEELQNIRPFTIYNGTRNRGRFGDRINFNVAWKDGDTVIKRVWTLAENDERLDILTEAKRSGGVTNCRVIRLHLGGGQTYWKIIDNDEAMPDEAYNTASDIADDEIPL